MARIRPATGAVLRHHLTFLSLLSSLLAASAHAATIDAIQLTLVGAQACDDLAPDPPQCVAVELPANPMDAIHLDTLTGWVVTPSSSSSFGVDWLELGLSGASATIDGVPTTLVIDGGEGDTDPAAVRAARGDQRAAVPRAQRR